MLLAVSVPVTVPPLAGQAGVPAGAAAGDVRLFAQRNRTIPPFTFR